MQTSWKKFAYFWTNFLSKAVGVNKIDMYITSTGLGTAKIGWDVRLKAALVQVGCLFGPSKSFTGLGIPSCS